METDGPFTSEPSSSQPSTDYDKRGLKYEKRHKKITTKNSHKIFHQIKVLQNDTKCCYEHPSQLYSSDQQKWSLRISMRGPDVEVPIFPSALMDYHVKSLNRSLYAESICLPYNQDDCHLKGEHSHLKSRASQRYMSDFKKSLEERRLVQAASFNDVGKVNNLLNRGVNPNCSDSLHRTPLHVAACKGFAGIVRMLLERGANPNSRDSIGNTALHLAACTNNIDVVLLLLKAGTDACSSDILGRSPLQLAQSKLKILHRARFPNEEIKKQVSMVIEMLLHFSKSSKQSSDVEALDLELLSNFQCRFKLSETRQDIDTQLCDLLDNLGSLSIKPA